MINYQRDAAQGQELQLENMLGIREIIEDIGGNYAFKTQVYNQN